jgi:hypothetical protein
VISTAVGPGDYLVLFGKSHDISARTAIQSSAKIASVRRIHSIEPSWFNGILEPAEARLPKPYLNISTEFIFCSILFERALQGFNSRPCLSCDETTDA